jgi:hypothetical protein
MNFFKLFIGNDLKAFMYWIFIETVIISAVVITVIFNIYYALLTTLLLTIFGLKVLK